MDLDSYNQGIADAARELQAFIDAAMERAGGDPEPMLVALVFLRESILHLRRTQLPPDGGLMQRIFAKP